ncbi:uncharacterized protein [Palaemon carinicauda]|uniref:uncharacterized protein n=1 Tax=Palaemon carinicauda TaxID=392227 RepID=UPI0035B69454
MAESQRKDPKYQACRRFCTSFRWEDVTLDDSTTTLLCDINTGKPGPWIPSLMRQYEFDFIHGLSHPSCRPTAQLLKTKFLWQGITKDAKDWVCACASSQTSKVYRYTDLPMGTFHQPQGCFASIHVYDVGPLLTSRGYCYMFTVINRSTRWPEAIPMETEASMSCTFALLSGWMARFGIPEHINYDRGTIFTSQL